MENNIPLSFLINKERLRRFICWCYCRINGNLWEVTGMSSMMISFENLDKESMTPGHSFIGDYKVLDYKLIKL